MAARNQERKSLLGGHGAGGPGSAGPPQGHHPQVDDYGDLIICEGICHLQSICKTISFLVCFCCLLAGGGLLCIAFFPCLIGMCFRFKHTWRLYLTRRGIYYTRSYCCFRDSWFIPLNDIEDIYVTANGIINVVMDPIKVRRYSSLRQSLSPPHVVQIAYAMNAIEFVEFVKREI